MKRLIATSLVSLFTLLSIANQAQAAAQRFVKVDIFKPAATSNRTLNVEYKVLSTIEADNAFGVQLFENSALKATQEIVHPYGDSGVFNISLPATGTYSYYVKTINHNNGDSVKDSATVTVQITNAPQPTVNTVTVNNPNSGTTPTANTAVAANNAAGGQGGATAGAAQTGSAQQNTPATGGQANGQVTPDAASTSKDKKDVLGSETKKTATAAKTASKISSGWYVVGGLAILLGGAGYYYTITRRANNG